ncbi:MAG: dihydroorotate dehydrogenase electron transfer subunit [Clostridiales bacterium]|nr:MAG: dihydroorotate dehydrogenase electron transfer subunit [Clostridiales bacterium]
MQQGIYTILNHEKLARDVYRLTLLGDTGAIRAPGQFVNILLEGKYLRRPVSICDWNDATITLIYKVVGSGTGQMSALRINDRLDLLVGLGNGFQTAKSGDRPLLIGGGVGAPPLYGLCKRLLAEGKQPRVILGFNTAEEVFLERELKELGVPVTVTTADGSYGTAGFVTEAIGEHPYTYFYTCGPEPMFRAIEKIAVTGGQFSFEERMGCGFGACMGCSCQTKNGSKRICREGPVLEREEIIW